MFSKDFLTNEIPVLNLQDTGDFALSQMEDCKLKQLPVVNDGKYVFLLSEKDIFQMENSGDAIENSSIFAPCVDANTCILDVLKVVNKTQLSVLPVVGSEGEYVGAILLNALLDKLGELCSANQTGALIALELNPQEYSLSQIIHLVEQNNARVLNVFSYMEENLAKQIVILKIDLEDASNVLRSLERFNYSVKYYEQKNQLFDETMRNRLNELIYYLEL
jgi:predicted transcriptional regulator